MKVGNAHWLVWVMFFDTLQRALCQCSGTPLTVTATGDLSKIESPGYPTSYSNDLNCEWLLDSGTAGQKIFLYSDHYDLDCPLGDRINIYDGDTTSSSTLATGLCGADFTTPEYISSDRYVLVTFTTDATGVSAGFTMAYISTPDTSGSGCSNQYNLTATDSPQYLTSENFPALYASGSSCRWLISAPDSLSTLDIELVFSDIEPDPNCQYDVMTSYDGSYICEHTVLFTDCSSRTNASGTPALYHSTSNSVLVLLTSDSSDTMHGFVLKYTANIVTTTTSSATAAGSGASAGGGSNTTSTKTITESELNIPLMAVSAISGAGAVLLLLATIWVVHHVLGKKKSKKGLLSVKAIAPLPARPAAPVVNGRTSRQNALSFV